MDRKKLLFFLLTSLGVFALTFAVCFGESEQPPFESKDPYISENFRNAYYQLDKLSLLSSLFTYSFDASTNKLCIDNPTFCVNALTHTVEISSASISTFTALSINVDSSTFTKTVNITPTTNQLILGQTRTVTLNAVTPGTASRTWLIPDISGNATFSSRQSTEAFTGIKEFQADTYIDSTKKLYLDGGVDTYLLESSDNILDLYTNSTQRLRIASSGVFVLNADLGLPATNKLFLDGGGDTYIQESSPNVLDIYTNGNLVVRIGSNTIATSTQTSIRGTSTNDNANNADVGFFISTSCSNQNVGTSAQRSDIVSFSLTAGDWDIRGGYYLDKNGATFSSVHTEICVGGTVTGNDVTGCSAGDNYFIETAAISTAFSEYSMSTPPHRISLLATTTLYLKGFVGNYTVAVPKYYATMAARRAR